MTQEKEGSCLGIPLAWESRLTLSLSGAAKLKAGVVISEFKRKSPYEIVVRELTREKTDAQRIRRANSGVDIHYIKFYLVCQDMSNKLYGAKATETTTKKEERAKDRLFLPKER